MKTKYLKKDSPFIKELSIFPCAGPRPNITGMRNLYWSKDAYVIKAGTYIYKVTKQFFENAK